jgi:ectoine hydroxylase-related dioxygenase (phytanoyl-CoA dioxygenase family)
MEGDGSAVIRQFRHDGWAVLPAVLSADELRRVHEGLTIATRASEDAGMPTRIEALDPGGRNVRVYDLVAGHPVFAELAAHPAVLPAVRSLLGADVILSNFTANTALPGSGSMNPHNDQSTVMPEPWPRLDAMNAIWCLHDTDEGNGATRYLPGSHRFATFAEVPDDPTDGMRSFEAPAGSVILMDGRLWHTSGANTSADRERSLLFAFYTRSYLRPQTNWWRSIPADRQRDLTPELQQLLALDFGNMAHGVYLTT